MTEFDSDDLDLDEDEDADEGESLGTDVGPVGEEDDDDSIFDVDQSEDEDPVASDGTPKPDYDEYRAEVMAEIRAENPDLDLPGQAPPESEPDTNVQHEARIDAQDEYEPGFEESQRERYQAEKAEREAQEFIEWSREFSAKQEAARKAAQAPPPEQREVAPPSVFDESAMDDATFDRILEARDAGLDYIPPQTNVDVSAVYGQFISGPDDGEEF